MIIEVIILLLAVPAGYLIAWMTRDELILGRKWFRVLIIAAFVAEILSFFYYYSYLTLTLAFIIIVAFISYRKSFDKKWVKKN